MSVTTDQCRFESAASLLPANLRGAVFKLTAARKRLTEEFRLRAGRPFTLVFPEGERSISSSGILSDVDPIIIEQGDITAALETATRGSVHSALENIRMGYVSLKDGHRLGICGTAVCRDGGIVTIKHPSSVSIRIARQIIGVSDRVFAQLLRSGGFENTLIVSPPGCGKTTLLRDMVRRLSLGSSSLSLKGARVALADERGEVAAQHEGLCQLDVGPRTDVLDNCPKSSAVMLLLRAMSPEVIAVDEITAPEDVRALKNAVGCGARLLATIHGDGLADLSALPIYGDISEIFRWIVTISKKGDHREYAVSELPGAGRTVAAERRDAEC
ncbi:stage III sporulation protein AA [Clostridia bacterium]|nr:stage III sporulation protein AA [Clostridia bacterium]